MKQVLVAVAGSLGLAAVALAQEPPPFIEQPPPPEQMAGPGPVPPQLPEIDKLTRQIGVLHAFLAMGLTTKDIRAVLPPLKSLLADEQVTQRQVVATLKQHVATLLKAAPDGPPPMGIEDKLRNLGQRHAWNERRAWDGIAKAIGPGKTQQLHGLLDPMLPERGLPARQPGRTAPSALPPRDGAMAPGMNPPQPGGPPPWGPELVPPGNGPGGPPAPQPGARRGQATVRRVTRVPTQGGEAARRRMMMAPMPPRLSLAELVELLEMKVEPVGK